MICSEQASNRAKRNWTLLTNHKDGSLLHNALTYHVGMAVGMDFCPGYKFVDLVINGEYRGNYQICDHVEVGKNRIDVDEDTGWYVETNGQAIMAEEPKITAAGVAMSIKNPEPATDAETTALKAEVKAYFDNLNYFWGNILLHAAWRSLLMPQQDGLHILTKNHLQSSMSASTLLTTMMVS